MQIFKNISNTPKGGEINHSVNANFDEDGNLNFTEHDMGEGVKEFWGRDEYEYFFTIPKNTPHGLEVLSSAPVKVLSIQSPQFKGADRIFINKD